MSSDDQADRPAGAIRQTLRALRHRNYRLFFMGQGTSLIGTWMQRIALGWLVFRLTGSELLLGVVGFASQILTFVFSPVAGVLADRYQRRAMLIMTQVVAMLQAIILTVLTMGNWINVPEIIALSLLLGLINAFDIPIRQSFNVEMLERRDDLSNVVALNSFMFNGARLIAPMLAGLLIAALGGESPGAMFLPGQAALPVPAAPAARISPEAWCFLLNAVSFLGAIYALMRMTLVPRTIPRSDHDVLHHLREGARYAFGFAPIRDLLLLLAVVNLLGTPYIVLMPAFTRKMLGGGAAAFGMLMSATGVGAMAGAAYLASRKSVLGLGRIVAITVAGFGAALSALAWIHNLLAAVAVLAAAGFCMMVALASCNTLIQTIVDEDKRGRVMGLYTMSFMGVAPFGALIAGWIADAAPGWLAYWHTHLVGGPMPDWIADSAGVSLAIAGSGLACVATGLAFAFRLPALNGHINAVYVKIGILPAGAIETDELPVPPDELRK